MELLDTFDESQREILSQYQVITQNTDVDEAIEQLIEYDWNIEQALHNIFEKNPVVDDNEQSEPAMTSSTTHTSPPTRSTNRGATTTPSSSATPRHSFIMSLLFWPFGIAWNFTWSIILFASRFMSQPTIGAKKPREPQVLAAEFIDYFNSTYGDHIDFFKGGYSQALEKAKGELKFMLVYLHSRDHDDTDEFCRHTLSTARVGNFIKDKNILLWGGDVREGEAHKVSYALKASTYPFMALIALQNTLGSSSPKMTVIERIEGPSHPEELISQIEIAIDRHGAVVNRLKNEKNQREMERQLRDDQDRAYKESLKADQEKERKAAEEKDAQLKAEEEAKDREMERQLSEQKREQYNRYLFNQLAEETKEQDPSKITRLNFRLADGSRVVRKFDKDATLDTLYKFVEIYPLLKEGKHEHQPVEPPLDYEHKFNFTIHSPYPRMEYEPSSSTKLCEISSLWPSATLVVDAVVDEDDEDDDME